MSALFCTFFTSHIAPTVHILELKPLQEDNSLLQSLDNLITQKVKKTVSDDVLAAQRFYTQRSGSPKLKFERWKLQCFDVSAFRCWRTANKFALNKHNICNSSSKKWTNFPAATSILIRVEEKKSLLIKSFCFFIETFFQFI